MPNLGLLSPEERELAQKKAQLTVLESELAERELALATLQAELRAFEAQYVRIVGRKFAERDDLQAQIAEAVAASDPKDDRLRHAAGRARERASETAAASAASLASEQKDTFKPSDQLRSLYRETAKRVHPDLATDERGRDRRTQIMAEINLAYEAGDEARLRTILEDWNASPDSVEGDGVAAELVRTIRKIHQVTRRLSRIDDEIAVLRQSELSHLREQVEAAQACGRDLFGEMRDQLEVEIERLRTRLTELVTQRARL